MIGEKPEPKIYTVSEFVSYMREFLKEQVGHVLILGEVSGFTISQDRFVFFDIKDKTSTVSCFMMKQNLKVPLEDGMEIKVLGIPQLYAKSGRFHIAITEIELVGEGALQKAYELLRKKLKKEGLFDEIHKQALPAFPEKIGIVTSETAAAYTDILRILKNRWSGLTIKLLPVKVQGIGSAKTIVDAFQYFNEHPVVDVIILTRGGGSLEDLQTFNSEDVARAVFSSKIPVICAVGHERDESLSDYVADVRASTPSNAAERVVPDKEEIKLRIKNHAKDIADAYSDEIENNKREVVVNIERMSGRMKERIGRGLEMISTKAARISYLYENNLKSLKQKIEAGIRLMKNLNPEHLLKKGYSLTWTESKKLIKSTKDIAIGDELLTQIADGTILSDVKEKK